MNWRDKHEYVPETVTLPCILGGVVCKISRTWSTHTHLTALFPGLPRWAGTRKVKPIWILLKQETVPDALPATHPTASKHWRQFKDLVVVENEFGSGKTWNLLGNAADRECRDADADSKICASTRLCSIYIPILQPLFTVQLASVFNCCASFVSVQYVR